MERNNRPWKEIAFERAALSGLVFFNRIKNINKNQK